MNGLSWTLPAPSATAAVPPATAAGVRDLLGYDVLYSGGLKVSPNGDYVRAGGMDNLKAAVYRRLVTRPGEFRFRPEYGVGVQTYVKRAGTQAVKDELRQRVVDQLSQDRRIQKVEVAVDWATVGGQNVLRVYVRCTSGGSERRFEPFTFAEAAA